jgi:hypothetical protein
MRQRVALLLALAALALTIALLAGVGKSHLFRLSATAVAPEPGRAVRISPTAVTTATVMQRPKFSGEDAAGRQWQLNARSATQSGSVSDSIIGLREAEGWWRNGSLTVVGRAQTAEYQPSGSTLALAGQVRIETSDTVIAAPAATADLTTQEVSGSTGVSLTRQLKGQTLHAQATQFTVDPKTQRAKLWGNVHVRLEPSR